MDPALIGKKIKELYPQYAKVDDALLGQKFMLKHGDKGLQSLGLSTTDNTKESATLRKEFSKETKDLGFKELQSSWDKVSNAEKTGAGDLTVIYSYIKALDPTTAVREGEINLTKAAESIPSNIIRAYQRAKQGKVMSPQLRDQMTSEIGRMYNERAKKQQELNAFYSGLATDMGVKPNDVIGGVGEIKLAEISPGVTAPQQDTFGKSLGNLLFGIGKSVADPFVTTARTGALGAQTAGSMALRNVAPQLASQIGRADILGSRGLARQMAEKPEEAFKEQLGASFQLALPKLLGMAGKGVGSIVGKVIPQKGAAAAAAAATGKLKTSGVIKAGEEFVKHEPAAKELWEVVKPTISKKTPAPDLMAKMFDVWKRAYSKGGDVKGNAEAQLYNKLYGAGRKVIEEQAPQLSGEISKLRFLHELPKKAQQASWFALKTAGIGKMLGL